MRQNECTVYSVMNDYLSDGKLSRRKKAFMKKNYLTAVRDKQIEFDVGHGTEGLIYVKQPQALPMTILGIYPRLETESV